MRQNRLLGRSIQAAKNPKLPLQRKAEKVVQNNGFHSCDEKPSEVWKRFISLHNTRNLPFSPIASRVDPVIDGGIVRMARQQRDLLADGRVQTPITQIWNTVLWAVIHRV